MWQGCRLGLGCVTLSWHRTEGTFCCWQQLPSPVWLPEQLTCSSTASEESHWVLWLLSGLCPRSAMVTGVCFAGAFPSAGSAKQNGASCLDSLCPSSPPHFPCIYEKSEHAHALTWTAHSCSALSALLYSFQFLVKTWPCTKPEVWLEFVLGTSSDTSETCLCVTRAGDTPESSWEAADGACDLLNSFPGGTELAGAKIGHRARPGHCWAWPAPPLAAPPGQNPN